MKNMHFNYYRVGDLLALHKTRVHSYKTKQLSSSELLQMLS